MPPPIQQLYESACVNPPDVSHAYAENQIRLQIGSRQEGNPPAADHRDAIHERDLRFVYKGVIGRVRPKL